MASEYENELHEAERAGRVAYDAMNAWLDRPADAPNDTPPEVLEAHARALRQSRSRICALIERHGEQPDLTAALAGNAGYHERLGLRL
jgi:hypothetical protein